MYIRKKKSAIIKEWLEHISDWYWMNFISLNIVLSFLLALGLYFFYFASLDLMNWFSAIGSSLLSIITGVFGVFIGFILTSIAILLSFQDGERIKYLRESGWYKKIINVFITTAVILTCSIFFYVSVLFVQIFAISPQIMFILILFSILVSFIFIFQCIWILSELVQINNQDKKERN